MALAAVPPVPGLPTSLSLAGQRESAEHMLLLEIRLILRAKAQGPHLQGDKLFEQPTRTVPASGRCCLKGKVGPSSNVEDRGARQGGCVPLSGILRKLCGQPACDTCSQGALRTHGLMCSSSGVVWTQVYLT